MLARISDNLVIGHFFSDKRIQQTRFTPDLLKNQFQLKLLISKLMLDKKQHQKNKKTQKLVKRDPF